MDAITYGGHHTKGIYVESARGNFAGVGVQFIGHVNGTRAGISLNMTYMDALDLATALINAAHRHGEIATAQAKSTVKRLNRRLSK